VGGGAFFSLLCIIPIHEINKKTGMIKHCQVVSFSHLFMIYAKLLWSTIEH